MKMLRGFATAVVAMAFAGSAQSALIFNIQQVGANVVMTGSGSLDTTGLSYVSSGSGQGQIGSNLSYFRVGSGGWDLYTGLTGYSTSNRAGTGANLAAAATSGSIFGVYGYFGYVYVPQGYQSGSALSGTSTFNNKTLSSLVLNPGTYTYTVPNDTITVNVITAVPEPASWAMMLVGFGLVGAGLRRRRGTVSFG